MNLAVLIVGGGGHAKVLIEALRLRSAAILGIIDADPAKIGTEVLGIRVIGDDMVISQYAPGSISLVNALGSIHLPKGRKAVFDKYTKMGFTFATVIHPSAVVASDVVLGEGVQIMAGAVIQPGSRIGMNTIINTMASVDHDCYISEHVHISPGATLSGEITVGPMSHIGTGATIIQGLRIGSHCLIGAGAVVLTDISENSTAKGAPAIEVKR